MCSRVSKDRNRIIPQRASVRVSALSTAVGIMIAGPALAAEAGARHTLTPVSMFLAADAVVKTIIVLLLVASVATWAIWIGKTIELVVARRRVLRALKDLQMFDFLAEIGRAHV